MKDVFMAAIKAQIDQMNTRLIDDAHTDFISKFNVLKLNPTELKDLAAEYVNLFHAQELQFNITKNLLK